MSLFLTKVMFTLYQIGFPGATKSYSVQAPMLTALARSAFPSKIYLIHISNERRKTGCSKIF